MNDNFEEKFNKLSPSAMRVCLVIARLSDSEQGLTTDEIIQLEVKRQYQVDISSAEIDTSMRELVTVGLLNSATRTTVISGSD